MTPKLIQLKEEIVQSLIYLALDLNSSHSDTEMINTLYKIQNKSNSYMYHYYNLFDKED